MREQDFADWIIQVTFKSMTEGEKNIAIVCNPLAGTGRATGLAQKIAEALLPLNVPYTLFKKDWPGNFKGFTDVWIAGGDGTLNYFINQYPDIRLPLVIFPGGTGNDVHWMLFGNKSFEEQLYLALHAGPRPADAGSCNERLFINGAGIGFEGAVAESLAGKKKRAGKTSFMIGILKKIFTYRSNDYSIQADEKEWQGKYLMISIANGCRAGGGFHIAPFGEINDGRLDLVMIKAISPLKRLRFLPVIEKGKHLGLSFIQYLKVKKVIVESNTIMQAHLDGEPYQSNRFKLEILPGKFLFRY